MFSTAILLVFINLNTIFSTKTPQVRILSFCLHFVDVPNFYKHLVHEHIFGYSIDTNGKHMNDVVHVKNDFFGRKPLRNTQPIQSEVMPDIYFLVSFQTSGIFCYVFLVCFTVVLKREEREQII